MFGSRTTVKKVRNSLTWFSHVVVGTGHHALVVFWEVFKTPRFSGFLELAAPGSRLHALVVFLHSRGQLTGTTLTLTTLLWLNWEVVAYCSFLVLLFSLTMVDSSYLVLQWFHLPLLVRVGGMFFLGFISGSVNPEMITWQPISLGSVGFLDDRSGSPFVEGFIVTDDAGFLSFGHLWLQSPRFCFYRPSRDLSSLQESCSVATAICLDGGRPSQQAAG